MKDTKKVFMQINVQCKRVKRRLKNKWIDRIKSDIKIIGVNE